MPFDGGKSRPIPVNVPSSYRCASGALRKRDDRQLNLTSYDRLFPNQDTMPKGGFGNLIALPLQKKPTRPITVFLSMTT